MDKIEDLLKLSSKRELEDAGNTLDPWQAHQILQYFLQEKLSAEKFLPILVGMKQEIFYSLLASLKADEENYLKEFGSTEPLLFKLGVLAHDWKQDLEQIVKDVYSISSKIETLNLAQITKRDIFSIRRSIDELDNSLGEHLKILNCALTIVWNSKRIDLIDSLSTQKDLYLRTSSILIGHPKLQESQSTGLFKKLEDRLNQVYSYDSALAPFGDNDPAIEALASFGIFYLEDYAELGLLPDIRSERELKNLLKKKSVQDLTAYFETMILQAEETLKNLGLVNVKSFKDAKIYSKDILKEYLHNRLSLSKLS